jgi:mannose-6-phosphate isomerase-like protein (cupin superfamily)
MRTLLMLALVIFSTPMFAQSTAPAPAQPKQNPPTTTPAPAQPRPRRAPAAPAARTGIAMTVSDDSGATLEGIHVEITGATTNSGETNTAGQINFPGLQPGTYRLRFSGDAVATFEKEVTLTAGRIANLTITLTPAPKPKTVEKAPAAPPQPTIGPVGAPQMGSVTNIANRERNTKEARREVLLSCSGNTRNELLVLTELQSERIYENAESTFYVVSGQGTARVGSLQSVIDTGSFVSVPRGTPFSLARQGKAPLALLWTLSGEPCEQAR